MKKPHKQETHLETFMHNGVSVELIRWDETIWCGSLGYAESTNDDVDVGAISDRFLALDTAMIRGRLEQNSNICMNLHHIVQDKPAGVMFAYLVDNEVQPQGFDVFKLSAGLYMCIPLGDNNVAAAIGAESWDGGPPPWHWVSEYIAPQYGYTCTGVTLPVIEYYEFDNGEGHAWLYVPVEKTL